MRRRFRASLTLALATMAASSFGQTIVIDRRPSTDEGKVVDQRLLLRELARQATLIAAERAGLATIDRTLVPRLAAPGDAIAIDVEQTWDAKNKPFAMAVRRAGVTLAQTSIPCDQGPGRTIPYDKVAAALAAEIDGPLAAAFRTLATTRPAANADEAATLRDVEPMLGRMNAFDAFRAIRRLHALVGPGGEASPATLSALARGYANLGESTRPLVGPHFEAAFARALLYADLLVARRPDDAASYWTRAYVRAIVSLTSAADDVAKAESLGGERPEWASNAVLFLRGDVGGLFESASHVSPAAPLAAHLAMRAVEFCDLASVAVQFADVALAKDPANIRAMLVVNDHSGVGRQHRSTVSNPVALNRAFDAILGWPELPAELRTAFTRARRDGYDANARLALWAALDREADGAAGPLPWAFLSEFARESSLILAQRRLEFVAHKWAVDPTDDFDAWWPVVRGHPFAPVIETYVKRTDKARLAAMPTADLHATFGPFLRQMARFDVTEDASGRPWERSLDLHFDRVLFEMQRNMWRFRDSADDSAVARDMARRLYEGAPNDLTALCWMVRRDWDGVKAREAELHERAATFPPLMWELGYRLLSDEPSKGIKILEELTDQAPDFAVFGAIANAYKHLGKTDEFVKTYERFIEVGEDIGL